MSASAEPITLVMTCELTCPHCGARHTQVMPTDACIYFFECTACGAMLKPKPGDCCVFCSYGSVPCPPMQTGPGCETSCRED
ncbi:MAG: GDCCVxC domain-containing (seleno)protein [Terriglobia bacterium]